MLKVYNAKDILIDPFGSTSVEVRLENPQYNSSANQTISFLDENNTRIRYPGNAVLRILTWAGTPMNRDIAPVHNMVYPNGLYYKYKLLNLTPGLYEFRVMVKISDTRFEYYYFTFKAFNKSTTRVSVDSNIISTRYYDEYIDQGVNNPIHTIDWSESSAEVGNGYIIGKDILDSGGIHMISTIAVPGVDYQIIQETSDFIRVKFLTPGRFNFMVFSNGYTSNNNPYPNSTNNNSFMLWSATANSLKVTANGDDRLLTFNILPEPVTINEDITFPKVSPSLTVIDPDNLISATPLSAYVMSDVSIIPEIDYTNVKFLRTENGVTTEILLTQSQWYEKTKNDLQVNLVIINSKLNIHDIFQNINLDNEIIYSFYPDDNYEVYYEVKNR